MEKTPKRELRSIHLRQLQQVSTPLKIPASPFMKNLGYGTGVSVFRLERSPKCGQVRSPLAVKRVSHRMRATDNAELFTCRIQEEAKILRKLSHPNIVGFRGVTKAKDGVDSLVLECCKISLGSILEERHEEELGPLPAKDTLKMISDIARALDYLHTEAKILHGDLKSFNVLVKGDFEICKLCDFGVSLPIGEDGCIDFTKNPQLKYVGTNLWSAPEVMDDLEIIDCKADIFSFGLVIYETIALVAPHTISIDGGSEDERENISLNSSDENSTTSSYIERMDRACGTRPPLPQAFELNEEYNRVVEIFYCCTNNSAEDRPMAKIIWQSLELQQQPEKVETRTHSAESKDD